jgi:ABC-type Na+ transport system ATPase subunit NatA
MWNEDDCHASLKDLIQEVEKIHIDHILDDPTFLKDIEKRLRLLFKDIQLYSNKPHIFEEKINTLQLLLNQQHSRLKKHMDDIKSTLSMQNIHKKQAAHYSKRRH